MLLSSPRDALARWETQPLAAAALPEAARFLYRSAQPAPAPGVERSFRESPLATQRRLEWLLLGNPASEAGAAPSLCVRDASGTIVGLLVAFPTVFVAGDRRLVALGSGGFFVDPQARTLGFYLFKRSLASPGYAFHFSTTCNAASGLVWRAVGAVPVPESDREYMLPLRLDVVLPSFVAGRTMRPGLLALARAVGGAVDRVRTLVADTRPALVVEPCRDWDKLAALARRHRRAGVITAERSAPWLEWRYGPGAPNAPFDIYVVRDRRGNEGWFSLGRITRGRHGQVRGGIVLDAVWPPGMRCADVMRTIPPLVPTEIDAVFFRPRVGVDPRACGRWLVARRWESPSAFVITPRGAAPVTVSALDLVPADGEGAF